MHDFVNCKPATSRVTFGRGRSATLWTEATALGRRAFVVASERSLATVPPPDVAVGGHFANVRQHVPLELAMAAVRAFRESGAHVVVSVGGGSATGFGKIIARDTHAPLLSVPTTLSGSERTAIWGVTRNGVKSTGFDPNVLPQTVVYDPALLESVPSRSLASSAANALAHSVEALWLDPDPQRDLVAEKSVDQLTTGLRALVAITTDSRGHLDDLLYGAYLAGTVLGAVGTGFHHEVVHLLGGRFDLPHAELHGCVLPYTAAALRAAGTDMARLDSVLSKIHVPPSSGDVLRAVCDLGVGQAGLSRFGLTVEELLSVAPEVAALQSPNGVPLGHASAASLLERAFAGAR